ncbi:MAG: polysaccharide deacetylase family protein, partial [Arthrobacter sp.]
MLLAVALSAIWILPAATAPVRPGNLNQAPDYPRKLLALQDLENIPKIGYQERASLYHRIALVEHVDGKTLLKDPFSDTVWREAMPEELPLIGSSAYVMEAYGHAKGHTLMLTFDDGPDPRFTPEILDLLSQEKVPATFFPVGDNIVKYPEIFRRIVREGHMVGNHTMSHIDFWAHDDAFNRQQIIGADRVMRAADNYATRLFRIPTGNPENNTLALLQAQQLGYLHFNMDIDTRDWEYAPGVPIQVPNLDGEGHVVLIHDGGGDRTATINMLKELIPRARAQGYTFTTIQPMLPTEFVPQHSIQTTVEDNVTLAAMTTYLVTPNVLLNWLFWFGIGSLTILTFLFVVLALINNSRQKKRLWDAVEDKDWPFV